MKALPILLVLALANVSNGYKIVMFPYGNRSHLIEFHGLGRVLLERGHEVHIFLSKVDTPPPEIANAGYKFINPNLNSTMVPMLFSDQKMIEMSEKSFIRGLIEAFPEIMTMDEIINRNGLTILNDQPTIEAMRKENFDFAVVDSYKILSYVFLLPRKLGIPYSGLTTVHDPLTCRIPHFPSAFSDIVFSQSFGVKADQLGTSFIDRLKNFFAVAFHEYWTDGWGGEVFKAENTTVEEVNRNMALNFVDLHYMLDEPLPTIPNVILVGGLATRPPRPIKDASLLRFIQDTSHPVVVCSFGTMMQSLTPSIVTKLFQAFQLLPQYRFVMRLKNANIEGAPDNLLILDWLPQNDLLAHNKTVLFITHSGNNGQNEALYHGMPMVAFYVFGDQLNNAERVERRGYGVKMNLLSFEHTDLAAAIERVITDGKYRKNIKRASEIFHEQNPGEIAADAVEHVIKFGSDHLRPQEALAMSLIEFSMLDIVCFLFTVIFLFAVFVTIITLRLLRAVIIKINAMYHS